MSKRSALQSQRAYQKRDEILKRAHDRLLAALEAHRTAPHGEKTSRWKAVQAAMAAELRASW